jgi:hypothetical protein
MAQPIPGAAVAALAGRSIIGAKNGIHASHPEIDISRP